MDQANQSGIPAQDPDHDIDATKTILALVVSAAFVFGSMIVMYAFFNQTIFSEIEGKQQLDTSENSPRVQLQQYEAMQLDAGEGRISVEESMQKYSSNNRR